MTPLQSRRAARGIIALAFIPLLVTRAHAGDRKLVTQGIVGAPVEKVWEAYTTDDGIKAWMLPVAHMDLRIGGVLETNYDKNAKIGDASNIRLEILSYEPGRMLSFTFKMPKIFPKAREEGGHWDVLRFDPLSPDRTLVTESMFGWGEGEDWDKAYAFFDKGNQWTMEQLQKHFAPKGEAKPEAAMSALRKLAGGVWTSEMKQPDGKSFRAKFAYEATPAYPFLTAKGWLGDDKKLALHASCIVGSDGKTGEVVQWNYMDDGSILRLAAREKDGRILESGEKLHPDGKVTHIRQEIAWRDTDHVDIRIDQPDEKTGEWKTLVTLAYTRVQHDAEIEALGHTTQPAK